MCSSSVIVFDNAHRRNAHMAQCGVTDMLFGGMDVVGRSRMLSIIDALSRPPRCPAAAEVHVGTAYTHVERISVSLQSSYAYQSTLALKFVL